MQRLPHEHQLFVLAVIVVASALAWLFSPFVQWQSWPELLLFLALISFASTFPIPDPRGGYITAAGILFYVLISVHGPGAGLIIAGSAYAVGSAISRQWIPWRTVFNGAQMGISVGLAGLVFKAVGGSVESPSITSLLLPLGLAAFTLQVLNNFFVAFYFSRLRSTPLLPTWISDIKDLMISNALSVPTAALLSILYVSVHPATLLIYLAFLPLQRRAHVLYLQQKRIYDQAINSLVVAIDADFPEGRGHSMRVAATSLAIARRLNLAESAIEEIELGALLHDVGTIGLYESDSERYLDDNPKSLQDHVKIGAEVARTLPRRDVAEIVLYHHEGYDGSGYPLGLKGDQIPLGARVVAVAEAFESMLVGGIPSREKLSVPEAVAAIREQAGKAFDPRVVAAFVEAVEENGLPREPVSLGQGSPENALGAGAT